MSFLKQTSGAKIYISTLPYTQNIQICHIEGQCCVSPVRCVSLCSSVQVAIVHLEF